HESIKPRTLVQIKFNSQLEFILSDFTVILLQESVKETLSRFLFYIFISSRLKASGVSLPQQNGAPHANNLHSPIPLKQNHRRESNDRIIRSVLNRDIRQNQTLSGSQSEHRIRNINQDRDKKPPRPTNVQSFQKNANGSPEGKVASLDSQAFHAEKEERRTRNRDRPDRGVWAPIRRSDGSHASDESLSSSISQMSQVVDSSEDIKNDVLIMRGGEFRHIGIGRGGHNSVGNGSYRQGGRRGSAYNIKDADGSQVEGKFPKRGGSSGHVSYEKQVWVQKSSPGS
ncbi:regulator of nonsense transcripts UPF3-like, partial [Primulina eburnea]|uniref:regulator of nonsense transcripts UPF3-like n=1 Tax=Primulina eburnea TaxID=1245227 RepID=UPI003C6C10FD